MSARRLTKNLSGTYKPEQTVNPQTLTTLTLDDICSGINELIKIETDNQKLLAASFELQAAILEELRENQDEGGVLSLSGTVTTTSFIFLDTITSPEHPVKGYSIKNDGVDTIYVGHNVTKAGLEPLITDVTGSLSRFRELRSGEEIRFIFNKRVVENIAILAKTGSSAYRGWLVW